MAILMGPVLSFRGCDDGNWNLTAIIVATGRAPKLMVGGTTAQAEALWTLGERTVWRYQISFPMTADQQQVIYKVATQRYEISVPGINQAPRFAYTSCNGFSSLKVMKGVKDKNALWKIMAGKHGLDVAELPSRPTIQRPRPYHLILQGGDQVYADTIWDSIPFLRQWTHLNWDAGNQAVPPDGFSDELDNFYFSLYTARWAQPEIANILARVASLAIWDDHDLIDGWGSYPQERQECQVFQAIWNAAAKAFAIFQQHLKTDEVRPGQIGAPSPGWWTLQETQATRSGTFSFAYKVGPVAVVAADMRSQRTEKDRVISNQHWDEIFSWVDRLENTSHLLFMSSIPVVYPGFESLEKILGIFPGHQDLEDDLRDHWTSLPHKNERLRLIHRLFGTIRQQIRTTILSGDVHVAALGIVQSVREQSAGSETVINQLISSGIVHPGPGGVTLFALRHLFDSDDEIDRGIIGRMLAFPGSQAKFLGGRNYLSIEPDDQMRLWCNWFVEGEEYPYTKAIHPLTRSS